MHLCERFTFFAKRFKMMSHDQFIIPDNFEEAPVEQAKV